MRNANGADNDWDWDYYYECRYVPYSPYRRNVYDRNYYNRDYDYTNYDNYTRSYLQGTSSGQYSGVGTRGCQRSDEHIEEEVNDRLTWHGDVDATDIQVDVKDGIVTLTGTVDDRRQKRMAEFIAENVSGVWDVDNRLTVRNRAGNREWGRERDNNRQIRPGMEVIGKDGNHVGEVKGVRSNDFLVDRSMARHVYIPFDACQVTNGQIRLNVRADDVDSQDWEMPDPVGTETTQRSQKKR